MPLSRTGRVLASAGTTLAFVGLAEGVARLVDSADEVQLPADSSFPSFAPSFEIPGWDLTRFGGLRGGGEVHVDDWNMRSPGYPAEKGQAVRVIFVGDSCVYGFGLDWEDAIPAWFERLRETRFPGTDYEVAACAVPGFTTEQSKVKLRKHCLAFDPDLVFISNLYNDSAWSDRPDRVRFKTTLSDRVASLLELSELFRALRGMLGGPAEVANAGTERFCRSGWVPPGPDRCPELEKPYPRVTLDEYRENLEAMIALVRDHGATPVLLLVPHVSDGDVQEDWPFVHHRDAMRLVARETDTTLVDGAEAFSHGLAQSPGIMMDRVHVDKAGARVFAAVIDRKLPEGPP